MTPAGAILMQVEVATRDTVNALREGFNNEGNSYGLAYLLGAVVVALIVIAAWSRRQKEKDAILEAIPDYLALAAEKLGLSEVQLADLQKVASAAGLAYPLSLILSPANLRSGVDSSRLSVKEPDLLRRMDELAVKLFDRPVFSEPTAADGALRIHSHKTPAPGSSRPIA